MYVSLSDIGLFILFLLAVIVSVCLIFVLTRAFCVLGHVRGILEDHEDDIRETLSVLPEVLSNVNELSMTVKNTVSQTSTALSSIQDEFVDTVDDLRDGLETFSLYAKVIGEIVRSIFSKSDR